MEKEPKKDPIEEAKKLLQEENQKKIEAFIKEYNELCQKHGLQIVGKALLDIANIK
jgi:hypothetical protein